MCHNDTPCLIPKNLLIYGHGQYHSHLLNTVLLCIHLKSNERRQRSHRYAGPQVCRLSTASIPPGCGMDKFQRRMPPRHPTDGNPLEVYGTSEHGGLLDIPGFGDVAYERNPADDSGAESLLYVGHRGRCDPCICATDNCGRKLFEV
jgi:hypothetical protein